MLLSVSKALGVTGRQPGGHQHGCHVGDLRHHLLGVAVGGQAVGDRRDVRQHVQAGVASAPTAERL